MPYRGVIFDLGGVVCGSPLHAIAAFEQAHGIPSGFVNHVVVTTAPGGRTRVHHHGECETSIWIVSGRAHYTFGPTGSEESMEAEAGDFVYIAADEVHVEENASDTEPLVVVITRNCPGSVVHYLDEG